MTNYAGYTMPEPAFFMQTLGSSLSVPLDRWDSFHYMDLSAILPVTQVSRGTPPWPTSDHDSYVVPDWSSNLFGHILLRPSKLALGNVLGDQTRTIEIANLFLSDQDWSSLSTDVVGLTFANAPPGLFDSPPTPEVISAFGSYLLQVAISDEGPAQVVGGILLGFDVETLRVPVTGTRIVVFAFQPKPGIDEELQWFTDIIESYDGSEQRVALRSAPRQTFSIEVILDDTADRRLRALLFDWLARAFAVPIWWEARRTTADALIGATSVSVDTAYGDFRVGGLALFWQGNDTFDAIEIVSMTSASISLASQLTVTHPAGTLCMPVRVAYAKTVPRAGREPRNFAVYSMQFTVLDNIDLADTTGQTVYDGKTYLDECNLRAAGDEDSASRKVTVLDADTGGIRQTSGADRSKFMTKKQWDSTSLQETWRVRKLLHSFRGSQRSFFLPTHRSDLTLLQTVSAGAMTLSVAPFGYADLISSRRPFADIRVTLHNGYSVTRRIVGATTGVGEETLTIDGALSAAFAIAPADIARLEFVMLARISDDRATLTHERLGVARINIDVTTVKE